MQRNFYNLSIEYNEAGANWLVPTLLPMSITYLRPENLPPGLLLRDLPNFLPSPPPEVRLLDPSPAERPLPALEGLEDRLDRSEESLRNALEGLSPERVDAASLPVGLEEPLGEAFSEDLLPKLDERLLGSLLDDRADRGPPLLEVLLGLLRLMPLSVLRDNPLLLLLSPAVTGLRVRAPDLPPPRLASGRRPRSPSLSRLGDRPRRSIPPSFPPSLLVVAAPSASSLVALLREMLYSRRFWRRVRSSGVSSWRGVLNARTNLPVP